MQIELICIGKNHFDYLTKGIEDYHRRINFYETFVITTLPEIKGKMDIAILKEKEEVSLLKYLKSKPGKRILLDEHGKQFTSIKFSEFIENHIQYQSTPLQFIIGGAYGFSESFLKEADLILSFSSLTYSHQLIRLIFVEQLYRAFTIIKKIPYHND